MFRLRGLGESWADMTTDETPTGEDRATASAYCGKKFGVTSPNFQPCVDFYAGPHIGEFVPPPTPSTTVKSVSNLVSKYGITLNPSVVSNKISAGPVQSLVSAAFPSGVPWYKTPIGIGAIILGGLFAAKKLRG